MSEKAILSKSTFVKSIQCLKALYLHKFYYNSRDPLPKERLAIFNRGHQVGELAQQLFPNGKDATQSSPMQYAKALQLTKDWMTQGVTTIYEAAFQYNGVIVYVDILNKENGVWQVYEVKSSLKISSTYILDASLQYYVIKNALKDELGDISLITMNGQYQLENNVLVVPALFKIKSITDDAKRNLDFIHFKVEEAKQIVAAQQMPDIKTGMHCFKPYTCDFIGTCWKKSPQHSIFSLPHSNKEQQQYFLEHNKINFEDLVIEDARNEIQKRVIATHLSNEIYFNVSALKKAFKKISSEIIFFDCEMSGAAIPFANEHAPYQPIPYLISLKTMANESFTHFLDNLENRKALFLSLINWTKDYKHIICYDISSETILLQYGIYFFPELTDELKLIKDKFYDISLLFKNIDIYHYEQYGGFSLKVIAQAFISKDFYDGLDYQSGLMASYAFQYYLNEKDATVKEKMKQEMIAYCEKDTEAVKNIYQIIQEKIK
jgi:Domain of unknown function(DUF2779)